MAETPSKYQPEPRQYEDEEWLYEQYVEEEKPIKEIAEETDWSSPVIRRALHESDIDVRPPPSERPEEWTRDGDDWSYTPEDERISGTDIDDAVPSFETPDVDQRPDWSDIV